MIDFGNFNEVFGRLSPSLYNQTFIQEAEANRRNFEGALFIDKVLAALGLAKGMMHIGKLRWRCVPI